MYRIIKIDGTELGITDSVRYIRIGDSGDLTPCGPEDAIGVAYLSVPYNLVGYNLIEGADTVVVSAIDAGSLAFQQGNLVDELILAALEG